MEGKKDIEKFASNDRLQNMLNRLSKCKVDYRNVNEDSKKIRDINAKLEAELKEARQLEKSHRYHLLASREMISNLQETVSQLVYLKRDVKRLKDEITARDASIAFMEKDKDSMKQKHVETVEELRTGHKLANEDLCAKWESKTQQIQFDCDTQVAQFTCAIEELRTKIKEMEAEHKEKMNVLVLEYEEKVQRSMAQAAQMQEQLARQTDHADANIDAYRRKLEEVEEKLKQQQFKEYLAHSNYTSQYENRVERPYSVERDPQANCGFDCNSLSRSQNILATPALNNQKPGVNSLQIIYQGNKNAGLTKPHEKKGQFNLTKKRKLYNEKDFLNM